MGSTRKSEKHPQKTPKTEKQKKETLISYLLQHSMFPSKKIKLN